MTDSAERWAEVEKAVELAKDSTRFLVTPEYPCLLELRDRVEALEANCKSTSNLTQIGSSLSPAEAGFDGASGISLNRADLPDGGVFRLRRGPTDPRHDRTNYRNQLVWFTPPGAPPELLWCNPRGQWFTCSFNAT
ncbi:hypothetical protein [Vulcanococcus sp.]|uniref:hypothetical protein n=1 Tax=Vulcanococcus sp. TaxID=2856995 RepID=UPI003F695C08